MRWSADGNTHTVETDQDVVTLWGLTPDTDVDWVVSAGRVTRSGTFHTARLPVPLVLDVVGDAVADDVLFPVVCDGSSWLALARTDGVVEWLEPVGQTVGGFGFAPPDAVLATYDRHTFARIGLDGRREEQTTGLPVHHDVAADGDGAVMLVAEAFTWDGDQEVVLDGLSVVDRDGVEVGDWSLADHTRGAVPPETLQLGFWGNEYPGAGDWSHGNAVTVTPDGDLLVSLRWWDSIYRLAGPGAADFGAVRWVLAGPGAPVASDLALETETGDDPGFVGQHHPLIDADGTLTVFDNGPKLGLSRVLRYRLGVETATLIAVTPLGVRCGLLGSAYPVADGGLLVTCADHQTAWEFGPGETVARWRMVVSCGDVPFNLNRVEPVVLPGG